MNKKLNLNISYQPIGTRPPVELPDRDFLKELTERGLRKLVSDHYNLLRKSKISHFFPFDDDEFEAVKKHSADFFVQVCGGPSYYNENRGRPMLVKRHTPFKITASARVTWLECYQQLLPELDISEHLIQNFWDYLNIFSLWMINTEE